MKKFYIFVLTLSVLFLGSLTTSAQSRYGVIGGMTFSNFSLKDWNGATMTKGHVGFTYRLDLPLGFSFQPSLIYNVKGAQLKDVASNAFGEIKMNYLELPVSIQWGPDLLIFRPFLDVTPFIGYSLCRPDVAGFEGGSGFWNNSALQRFEYGLGLGVGLDIWRFQVIGRYNWNFGSLYQANETYRENINLKNGNYGGFTLSVAFLFGGGWNTKKK